MRETVMLTCIGSRDKAFASVRFKDGIDITQGLTIYREREGFHIPIVAEFDEWRVPQNKIDKFGSPVVSRLTFEDSNELKWFVMVDMESLCSRHRINSRGLDLPDRFHGLSERQKKRFIDQLWSQTSFRDQRLMKEMETTRAIIDAEVKSEAARAEWSGEW